MAERLEDGLYPNPNYRGDGVQLQMPMADWRPLLRKADGSPAWFVAHFITYNPSWDRLSRVPDDLNNNTRNPDRWTAITPVGNGVNIEFNFDRTGKAPDWGTAHCTWDEIEARSGGVRL